MESIKTALGVACGVGVGVVLGVLFAPDKGSNTRRKIMDKGKDYIDDLKNQYDDMKNQVSENFSNSKESPMHSTTPDKNL